MAGLGLYDQTAESLRKKTEAEAARQTEESLRRLEEQRRNRANQQSQPQISPAMASQFMGKGAGLTGGATSGTAGGTSAATSSSSSAVAGLGPWAALAAVIALNENSARNSGARADGTQYYKDLIGGKVLSQDINERWVPKLFGGYENDKTGLGHDMGVAGELSTFDFSNALKKAKNSSLAKVIKKIL